MAGAISKDVGRGSTSTELMGITALLNFRSLLRGDASDTDGGTSYPGTATNPVYWGINTANTRRDEMAIVYTIPTTAVPRKANVANCTWLVENVLALEPAFRRALEDQARDDARVREKIREAHGDPDMAVTF